MTDRVKRGWDYLNALDEGYKSDRRQALLTLNQAFLDDFNDQYDATIKNYDMGLITLQEMIKFRIDMLEELKSNTFLILE